MRVADRGGGLEQSKRKCMDKESWRFSCCGIPLGKVRWQRLE